MYKLKLKDLQCKVTTRDISYCAYSYIDCLNQNQEGVHYCMAPIINAPYANIEYGILGDGQLPTLTPPNPYEPEPISTVIHKAAQHQYLQVLYKSVFQDLCFGMYLDPSPHVEFRGSEPLTIAGIRFSLIRYLWECPELVLQTIKFYNQKYTATESLFLAHYTIDWANSGHAVWAPFLDPKDMFRNFRKKLNKIPKIDVMQIQASLYDQTVDLDQDWKYPSNLTVGELLLYAGLTPGKEPE